MLEINRYRLNLYELLYKNPLCDYRVKNIDKDKLDFVNVLFIGSKDKAIETYKTMFWASQYPNCRLRMTFMGKTEDLGYVKSVFSDKKKYPALDEYITKGYSEPILYQNIDIGLDKIIDNTLFRYIIIATSDAYKDWEYLANIEAICEKNENILDKVFVAIYNDGLNDKFASINWNKVASNIVISQFEKSEEQINTSDLKRIAANINLAYSVMYDERLNIENNLKEFDKLCKEEFDLYNSKTYNADSSYANAVHISAKLSYCLEYQGFNKQENSCWKYNAMELLSEATIKNSELYKKLYYLEHRRWNAYTVMRGYRQPKDNEWDFVYTDSKKNVEKDKRLHVCLCESGQELNTEMEKPKFWTSIKKEMSPLDYASYRCNLIASYKSKKLEKFIYSKYEFINGILFRELKEAIENLFIGVSNANDDYKRVYDNFIKEPEIISDKILLKKLSDMNEELNVVIIRNKHINFFKYDAQLVKLMPFSLWYGEKYKEVFVFSRGIATKDVVVPTLLYAKKAYFVMEDKVTESYKNIVSRYFIERGNNTSSYFITYDEMLELTENKQIDEYVITGEGEIKENFLTRKNDIVNVHYNPKKNSIDNQKIFGIVNNQSFSIREFIRLLGGDIKEEFRDTLPNRTYSEYESLFWNFSDKITQGSYTYIPWNKVIKLFSKDSRQESKKRDGKEVRQKVQVKTQEINLNFNKKDVVYICDTLIMQEQYLDNMLDEFLIELSDYHLISKYNTIVEKQNIRIRFITYYKEICEIITSYSGNNKECYITKLAIGKKELNKDNMIVQYSKDISVLIENCKNTNEFKIYQYEKLLKELIKVGAISDYKVENNLLKKVTIKDMRIILRMFEKEGDIFEKITFHKFQNSGIFNDVRNGVYFYWNREKHDKQVQQKKLKKVIEDVASNDIVNLINAETFCELHNQIFKNNELDYEKSQVSNEIDVIATRGMQAYFISCKATSDIVMGYELEIADHAKNAGAIPVLCTAKKVESNSDAIVSRASQVDKIILMGRDELIQQNKFDTVINNYIYE